MNSGAATIVAEGFLKGVFDVLDAVLASSFAHEIMDINDVDESAVLELAQRYPVVLRARLESGGAVGLFLASRDAARFAALVVGDSPGNSGSLSENDLATLTEVAEPCLGGGITNIMERVGRNVQQPREVTVLANATADPAELVGFLQPPLAACSFTFAATPDLDSTGVFVFSNVLESLVPESMAKQAAGKQPAFDAQPRLSEAEMSDILSGFSPDGGGGAPRPNAASAPAHAPSNMEMVLDIRLVATARLGRVELPLADILALGPGSILDVGHLVDDPVELLVNGKLIARGDVVVVDEKFGLRVTEIVSAKERIESLS